MKIALTATLARAARILTLAALAHAAPALSQTGELPLRPNDKILISIGGIPVDEVQQISKSYTISDAGKINLLHIGEVTAASLKPSDLQKRIEETYKSAEIYTHPTVTVTMDATAETARVVYVISGCMKNGPVQYRSNLTLLQAVGTAGGPTAFAQPKKTKLIRTNADGNRTTTVHDLTKITKEPKLDVPLQPDDQIILPE